MKQMSFVASHETPTACHAAGLPAWCGGSTALQIQIPELLKSSQTVTSPETPGNPQEKTQPPSASPALQLHLCLQALNDGVLRVHLHDAAAPHILSRPSIAHCLHWCVSREDGRWLTQAAARVWDGRARADRPHVFSSTCVAHRLQDRIRGKGGISCGE